MKGVTGYDVTGLLVGSEGTLAVFGDITLQLIPKPESVMTLLSLFPGVTPAGAAVEAMTAAGTVPRCIELLDAETLQAMRLAGNAIDQRAGAMLLIDVDGDQHGIEWLDAECAKRRVGLGEGRGVARFGEYIGPVARIAARFERRTGGLVIVRPTCTQKEQEGD